MERKQSAAKSEVSEVSWLGRSKRREKKVKVNAKFSVSFLGHFTSLFLWQTSFLWNTYECKHFSYIYCLVPSLVRDRERNRTCCARGRRDTWLNTRAFKLKPRSIIFMVTLVERKFSGYFKQFSVLSMKKRNFTTWTKRTHHLLINKCLFPVQN